MNVFVCALRFLWRTGLMFTCTVGTIGWFLQIDISYLLVTSIGLEGYRRFTILEDQNMGGSIMLALMVFSMITWSPISPSSFCCWSLYSFLFHCVAMDANIPINGRGQSKNLKKTGGAPRLFNVQFYGCREYLLPDHQRALRKWHSQDSQCR